MRSPSNADVGRLVAEFVGCPWTDAPWADAKRLLLRLGPQVAAARAQTAR